MTDIRIEAPGLAEFAQGLLNARWEQPLQEAYDDSGEKVAEKARGKAGSAGGAAGLTAGTLEVKTAFDRLDVTASTPFARGSEFGSGGANPSTRQFSNRPGSNNPDGYWLGPALEESGDEIVRRFGDAVDDVARPAFGF